MNVQPQRTGPSPLSCAVTLGEAVRDEHGRAGVEAYVKALAPLLPHDLIDQLAYRLNVPIPQAPPPPPPGLWVSAHNAAQGPVPSPSAPAPASSGGN